MQFKSRSKKKVLINITPLIDVLFLLLIFFMVSSTFLEQPAIKLELPEAQSSSLVENREYILFVDKQGKMFLNKDEVSFDNLEEKIKEVIDKMKDKALVLKADTAVSHGKVVKVMDIVKKSGVAKLIIGTRLETDSD